MQKLAEQVKHNSPYDYDGRYRGEIMHGTSRQSSIGQVLASLCQSGVKEYRMSFGVQYPYWMAGMKYPIILNDRHQFRPNAQVLVGWILRQQSLNVVQSVLLCW